MERKKTILLTGATGLLGSYLLKLFLEEGHKVYALARSKDHINATSRVINSLRLWDETISPSSYAGKLIVVDGDITSSDFKIETKEIIALFRSEVEMIFHCAALTLFRAPLEIMRKINVEGTKNILDFSLTCLRLKNINYISTAFVAGNKNGIDFDENMLELGQGFYNTYEQTKYEVEILLKDYQKKGLIISIFRPSVVMGDSKEGKTNNFHLFYEPTRFFSQGFFPAFPMNLDCSLNLINIDIAAKAIFILSDMEKSDVYHIVSPEDTNMHFFAKLASSYFNFEMPEFIPEEKFDFSAWTDGQKLLGGPFVPYCNYKTKFVSHKTQQIMSQYNFIYPQINESNLTKIFEYCDKVGFIKRKRL
ncbi:MAG: SDR family oxidoreductase [Candidatus Omnitrophota bacterium]